MKNECLVCSRTDKTRLYYFGGDKVICDNCMIHMVHSMRSKIYTKLETTDMQHIVDKALEDSYTIINDIIDISVKIRTFNDELQMILFNSNTIVDFPIVNRDSHETTIDDLRSRMKHALFIFLGVSFIPFDIDSLADEKSIIISPFDVIFKRYTPKGIGVNTIESKIDLMCELWHSKYDITANMIDDAPCYLLINQPNQKKYMHVFLKVDINRGRTRINTTLPYDDFDETTIHNYTRYLNQNHIFNYAILNL